MSRAFHVGYQLKLAELCCGQVVSMYLVPYTRCFATDELNVILADIYTEVGPAPNLLGIEILTIRRVVLPCPSLYFLANQE
jgi:hypothetical protein